ncbi:MAG TPA: hypothetical protein VF789_33940 [Thermoanaerobaculia bacterium]
MSWASCGDIFIDCDLFEQRFALQGAPLSPRVRFNRARTPADRSFAASVAVDGQGNSIAVWEGKDVNGPFQDIYAQRASGTGEKIGRMFVVNPIRLSAQRYPSVAADRHGNFVIAWQSFDPTQGQFFGWHVRAQLFRKDGRRVGPEIVIADPLSQNDQWEPTVVFGPNGTFLLHYIETGPVLFRRYAASPADEPCVWSGAEVRCDTGRTGGEAELPLAMRLYPGDVPLFGDVDGDGRADPCLRRGRALLCDTDHEGGAMEFSVRFGRPDETPLLGDVNGDGRADPCVRSGRFFLCDTKRDGGRAEWSLAFGDPGDLPLLGDLDGDGRDDPCVFRGSRLLCDTAHDGGAAEVVLDLPTLRGDLPVLGDFDGDGRDDACLLRVGRFLCDTAHDGGRLEAELSFGHAGDRPLLGNLDGL